MEGEEKESKIALIGVNPEGNGETPKYELKSGRSYLIESTSPKKAYSAFVDAVNNNMAGLIITRRKPDEVRANFSLKNTPILWLRGTKSEEPHILATDLGEISIAISEFSKNSKNSIVLLDGIEYLINNNDFKTVTQLIELIDDMISISDSCFLLLANPLIFDKKELSFLEREIEYKL